VCRKQTGEMILLLLVAILRRLASNLLVHFCHLLFRSVEQKIGLQTKSPSPTHTHTSPHSFCTLIIIIIIITTKIMRNDSENLKEYIHQKDYKNYLFNFSLIHPFMAIMFLSSDGYFLQDNAPCHKAWIISNWFLEHDNDFTVIKWPTQSPDLNPIEHLWDVVERVLRALHVHPTNLHKLQDAIQSIKAKISKECFQHLVESILRRIKAVLKAKGGQTQY